MKGLNRCRPGRAAALLLAVFFFFAGCRCSGDPPGAGPLPARRGLSEEGRMQVSGDDRCPVCAMPVAAHERFSAAIILSDDTAFYFCTPGCMLRGWMEPVRYLNRSREQLSRPVVRDYFSGAFVDGRQAFWVSGSDVVGPMGPALVALRSERDLAAFRRRHGGERVFRLPALRVESWKEMTGRPPVGEAEGTGSP